MICCKFKLCSGTRREQEHEKTIFKREEKVYRRIRNVEDQLERPIEKIDMPGRKHKVWHRLRYIFFFCLTDFNTSITVWKIAFFVPHIFILLVEEN